MPALDRLGRENLDAIERHGRAARHGLRVGGRAACRVATEPHQVAWLAEEAESCGARRDACCSTPRRSARRCDSPTYLGGVWAREQRARRPGAPGGARARRREALGVEIYEGTPVTGLATRRRRRARRDRRRPRARRAARCSPRTCSRRSCARSAATVPVYDYVLITEPLRRRSAPRSAGADRQGIGDLANQFHYYRLTADDRILFGGYDAVYHYGGRVARRARPAAGDVRAPARALPHDVPAARGAAASATAGAARSTRVAASARSAARRAADASHTPSGSPGSASARRRFGARVDLDLLDGADTERTRLEMVRAQAGPVPARAGRDGRASSSPAARSRAPTARRPARAVAAAARPARPGVRLVTPLDCPPV